MTKKTSLILLILPLLLFISLSELQAGERFIDNDDGTVTDTLTNLMWAKDDNMGDITWHDAGFYCKNPPVIGFKYSDWRMPTIEELKTLYDKDSSGYETICGLRVKIYPIFALTCAWVWASDTQAISAYAFSFRKGYQYSTLRRNKISFRALPVRNLE
jgi:hypothetical protein